jgi:hypothetical protein
MRLLIGLTLTISLYAQQGQHLLVASKIATSSNNVALVGGHTDGTNGATASTLAISFSGASVTSGNTVFCGVSDLSFPVFAAGFLTKTAGTSTIGTVAMDQSSGTNAGVAIYRVPITGTGTVTLTYNPANGANYRLMGCAEFSGVNATPLSTHSAVTGGPGTLHTTGSITTTDIGVMIYMAAETPNNDFTRSWSDQIIYHIDTGGSTNTGILQYKIINASPNTMQDCTGATPTLPGGACNTGGDSESWDIVYALYKST